MVEESEAIKPVGYKYCIPHDIDMEFEYMNASLNAIVARFHVQVRGMTRYNRIEQISVFVVADYFDRNTGQPIFTRESDCRISDLNHHLQERVKKKLWLEIVKENQSTSRMKY